MAPHDQHAPLAPEGNVRAVNPKTILVVAAFAAFLATFNETFLNVGFAPIMGDLNVDVSTVQWLATAYMLGAAVMVPISAFAYRSFLTRPLFCMTTMLLVIGSVVGALAQDFAILLIGRIIQALGTGMLIPIGMNITLEIAPREKLGSYMGIMGAMTTLGPSSSVILAGIILQVADWHMLLWVFGGLSALCLLMGAILLRNIAHLTHPRLDALSVALIGIALIGILYGISTIFVADRLIAMGAIIVGLACGALFVRRQDKLEEPLINLRPLKVRAFTVGTIANMISLIVIFAMNIIVPTFMQSVLGTDPLIASLTLFPAILFSCIVSPLAGRVYDAHGIKTILPCGFACIAIFSVAVSLLIATVSPIILAIIYIPVICGSALVIGPVQSFALSRLTPEENPHGVTIMSTGFQIAGCIGSSVFTGVYAAVGAASANSGETANAAAAVGMGATGILLGIVALIGFILALYLRKASSAPAPAWEHSSDHDASPSFPIFSIMKHDVYCISEDAPLIEAMQMFSDKGISGVPVVDGSGIPFGFISDGDVMRSLADQVPAFKTAYSFIVEAENEDFSRTLSEVAQTKVGSICTKRLVTVSAEDDLGSITKTLADHHLKKAPVMQDGKMVGIVNRSNITRWYINDYLGTERGRGGEQSV